jgi:peptidoglycan/xylan/chitin deacetylase (PgdA/CDA1 family)
LIVNYRPPWIIQKLFKDFHWTTTNNRILLTFDDGPTGAGTERILKTLNSNNIHAMFFCVGGNIKKLSHLVQKIIDEGHSIANHTMNHKILPALSSEEMVVEIESFNYLMKENYNYDVKYIRPPHGRFNLRSKTVFKKMNMNCVMWNLLTYDFENDFGKVKYGIDKYLLRNSIIVLHDNIKCADIIEESLNYIIEAAKQKGYQFGEPQECLK